MAGCLGDDTIAAYVDGTLVLGEIERVDRHIDTCDACRAQLSAVAAAPVMHSFVAASPSRSTTLVAPPGATPPERAVERGVAPAPGSALGRYVVDGVLGRGGMGVVVRAYDPELDRRVAIKLVDPSVPGGRRTPGAWRARLRSEARAMARLRHPNVVGVYDVGSVGDQLFVAMELVDGDNLARWLTARGERDRGALAACVGAGRGLCAAHAAGIVHGDVKPENILVDRDGRAMIGDFGLAHAVADAATSGEPRLAGTPAYMAPELFRGAPADARSDQFALAVTVYEALVGERPWRGDSLDALRAAIDRTPPPRPAAIPAALWPALERALAADPAARHPSLAAFVDRLDRGAPRRRVRAWVAAGTGAAVIGIAIVAAVAARDTGGVACPDPAARTSAVASAAAPLCGPGPGATCTALAAALDQRLATWRSTHVAVCRATRDGRQSPALLDGRMRCLERRLAEQAALLDRVGPGPLAERDALDALAAIGRLAGPAACATVDASGSYAAAPPDRARAVALAEQWVATAAADYALGRYRAGLDAFAPHQDAIRALAHPPLVAAAAKILGNLQRETGDLAGAEASFDAGLAAAAEAGDDATSALLLLDLAYLVGESRQELDRGVELLRAAAAAVVRAGNPPELESLYLLERGGFAEQRGDFTAAAADFTRAYELRRTSAGAGAGDTAVALQRLCGAEGQIGKLDEARRHCEEAVTLLRAALGADHPIAAAAESELAVAFAIQGDLISARQHWLSALASLERSLGPDAPRLGPVLLNLGDVSRMLNDADAARRYLDRAIQITGADADDVNNLDLRTRIARQLRDTGKRDEAIAMLDDIVRRAEARLGRDHPTTASALSELAVAYYEVDRYAEARAAFERAIAAHSAIYGERHAVTLSLQGQYGQTLMALHQPEVACPVFERVMLVLEATVGADSPFLAQAYANDADCLLEIGDPARAADLAEKGFVILERRADDPLHLAEARFILGQALWRANRDRKRAVTLVTTARDEMKAIGADAVSLPRVQRWLAGKR